ncbi:hypothetical protein [Paraburkholderia hayleyella]|nr:hypothetical protein [Paraburkholderia hayleyella]
MPVVSTFLYWEGQARASDEFAEPLPQALRPVERDLPCFIPALSLSA